MSKSTVITARVDPEVSDLLAELAKRLGRSRASVAQEAVTQFVREQTAFFDFIDEGVRDIEAGNFYTQEEMDAWFDERIAHARSLVARDKAA